MVGSTGVGIAGTGIEPSGGVKTILQWGNLVVVKGRSVEITKDGFAFILQEVNAQVWTILVLYLQNAPGVCKCDFRRILIYHPPTNTSPARNG